MAIATSSWPALLIPAWVRLERTSPASPLRRRGNRPGAIQRSAAAAACRRDWPFCNSLPLSTVGTAQLLGPCRLALVLNRNCYRPLAALCLCRRLHFCFGRLFHGLRIARPKVGAGPASQFARQHADRRGPSQGQIIQLEVVLPPTALLGVAAELHKGAQAACNGANLEQILKRVGGGGGVDDEQGGTSRCSHCCCVGKSSTESTRTCGRKPSASWGWRRDFNFLATNRLSRCRKPRRNARAADAAGREQWSGHEARSREKRPARG